MYILPTLKCTVQPSISAHQLSLSILSIYLTPQLQGRVILTTTVQWFHALSMLETIKANVFQVLFAKHLKEKLKVKNKQKQNSRAQS